MVNIAIVTLVFCAFVGFSAKRLMTYLHILQQDDYDSGRLFKWMIKYTVFAVSYTHLRAPRD